MGYIASTLVGVGSLFTASSYYLYNRMNRQIGGKNRRVLSLNNLDSDSDEEEEIEEPEEVSLEKQKEIQVKMMLAERARQTREHRKSRKRAVLYFNSNDEYMTEEQALTECYASGRLTNNNSEYDSDEEKDEVTILLEEAKRRYHPVEVNFGDEDIDLNGTTKITKEIFEGTQDKTENAEVFLENLAKTMKNSREQTDKSTGKGGHNVLFDGEDECESFRSLPTASTDGTDKQNEVILNISPKKYSTKRDQLFIDFFSMYTKRSVQEKKLVYKQHNEINHTYKNYTANQPASYHLKSSKNNENDLLPEIIRTKQREEFIKQGRPKVGATR